MWHFLNKTDDDDDDDNDDNHMKDNKTHQNRHHQQPIATKLSQLSLEANMKRPSQTKDSKIQIYNYAQQFE